MTISYRFLLRRGLAATLASVNEIPLEGEMVIETDTRKFKFGDGVTAWNSLTYSNGLSTVNNANWSGTDLALDNGGTGASLTDPNADRIMFWDDSAGAVTWLTAGANLTITGTTIDVSGLGTMATQDASAVDITGTLTFSGSGGQPIVQRKVTGYGGGYQTLMVGGQSQTSIALGIDASTVAGGNFNGDGKELMVPSGFSLTAPNAAGTDWDTKLLSVDGGVLSFGATGTRRISVTTGGLEPYADNTYYLGRNSASTPKAFKGLILKDQVSGTYYRLEINSGAVALTAL